MRHFETKPKSFHQPTLVNQTRNNKQGQWQRRVNITGNFMTEKNKVKKNLEVELKHSICVIAFLY